MNKTLDQIDKFLKDKDNRKYHFNNYDEEEYKISSGSLNLDLALGGGLPAGAHRFTGVNEGGKTSCALAVGKNFQEYFGKNGMVVIIKSEGRLSSEMLKRSGINTDPEQLFIFDCNVFEKVFEFIRDLVFNNEDNKKYMFIIDSVDALCRINDIDKPFAESEQVAGGALVTSVFLKKMVLPITKMGHMMILTSQIRIEIPSSAYAARGGPKIKQAGGNAIKHYANFILEFEERYNNDIMWENPSATKLDDKGNPIGHYCKARFRKSINEKTGAQVRYPIRYGRTNGNSIWVEKEVIDMLYLWGYIEKKGAWISFDEELLADLKKKKIECPEKVHGDQKLLELIESNGKLMDYFQTTVVKLFNEEE